MTPLTRRQFVKAASAAMAGGAVFGPLVAGGMAARSRVVRVADGRAWCGPGWSDADLDPSVLRAMLARALVELTGAATASAALAQRVPGITGGDQRIGVKVNGVNQELPSHPAVVEALVALLVEAGARAERVVVFDRTDRDVEQCGFTVRDSGTGRYLAYGTDHPGVGHDDTVHTLTHGRERLSRIITERIDHLISVPVLKNHQMAGVTLSLKNHFGSIDLPQSLHGSDRHCSPGIAEVNALAPIRDKTRLALIDATFGTHVSGLGGKPDFAPMSLIVSADPVAADAVGRQLIDQRRAADSLDPVEARHLSDAAALGLGSSALSAIDSKIVELSRVTEKPRPWDQGAAGCGCRSASAGAGAALAAPLLAAHRAE